MGTILNFFSKILSAKKYQRNFPYHDWSGIHVFLGTSLDNSYRHLYTGMTLFDFLPAFARTDHLRKRIPADRLERFPPPPTFGSDQNFS